MLCSTAQESLQLMENPLHPQQKLSCLQLWLTASLKRKQHKGPLSKPFTSNQEDACASNSKHPDWEVKTTQSIPPTNQTSTRLSTAGQLQYPQKGSHRPPSTSTHRCRLERLVCTLPSPKLSSLTSPVALVVSPRAFADAAEATSFPPSTMSMDSS